MIEPSIQHEQDKILNALRHRGSPFGLEIWLYDIATQSIIATPVDHTDELDDAAIHATVSRSQSGGDAAPFQHDDNHWVFPVALTDARDIGRCVAIATTTSRTPRHADMQEFSATLQSLLLDTVRDTARSDDFALAASDLSRELSESYERMSVVFQIGRSMTYSVSPIDFVVSTCEQILALLDFEWIAVQYFDRAATLGIRRRAPLTFGAFPADPMDFKRIVGDIVGPDGARPLCSILDLGEQPLADLMQSQVVINPIMHDELVIGMLCAGGKVGEGIEIDVTSHETQVLEVVAELVGVFQQNAFRFAVQQSMFNGTIGALSSAIDAKDPYTRGHSERVAYIGKQIAIQMGLSSDDVEHVYIAGLVHDVGKIGIPESVLCKAGPLTDDEWKMMKDHPQIGYEILKDIPQLEPMLPGVLHHHECWDGGGYPHKLIGDDIPPIARILAVADAFDAMSSDRAYRARRPRSVVLDIMRENDRGQWDQDVVDVFVNNVALHDYDEMIARQARVGDRFAA